MRSAPIKSGHKVGNSHFLIFWYWKSFYMVHTDDTCPTIFVQPLFSEQSVFLLEIPLFPLDLWQTHFAVQYLLKCCSDNSGFCGNKLHAFIYTFRQSKNLPKPTQILSSWLELYFNIIFNLRNNKLTSYFL